MKRDSLFFLSPGEVEIRQEEMPTLMDGQVLVKSIFSAISPGTEMLVYRGQFPDSIAVDETLSELQGEMHYPLKYGYAMVGEIIEDATGDQSQYQGRKVFAFHPHESHFATEIVNLHLLPEGVSLEDAVFLANMETAVNLVMDGAPVLGERVAVLGQGIVGLLTTAILAEFPLEKLVTYDYYALRRQASLTLEIDGSFDPDNPEDISHARKLLEDDADLVYELSGSPTALNEAIAVAGYGSRVVIGSWYGQKQATLDLGGRFHRSRMRLISSQVSTIAPALSGRWDKKRRFETAWEMIRRIKPSKWITHTFPISEAAHTYHLIDQNPENTIQVLFSY